jgi:hypothetical protein
MICNETNPPHPSCCNVVFDVWLCRRRRNRNVPRIATGACENQKIDNACRKEKVEREQSRGETFESWPQRAVVTRWQRLDAPDECGDGGSVHRCAG